MADETTTTRNRKKAAFKASEHDKKIKENPKTAIRERLCFVITKNKGDSWADDLYACGRIADLQRVYH